MSSSSCTLCPTTTTTNGTFVYNYDPTANIPLRNGGGSWQCADLDTRLLPFVAAEASECTAVQSVLGQGICGCSVDTATSCSLCPDGTEMPASRRVAELAFLDASVILNTTTWNPVIATMLESLQVNCALLQAFVQTTSGNGLCTTSQVLLQDFCCSADFAQPKHPCVVDTWGDDEPKVRLGRNNDDNDLDSNENNHLTLTCSQLQQAAMLWENDSQMCVLTNALATLSDCPTTPLSASSPSNAIASPCAMCRDGSAVTLPDKIVDSNLFSTTTKTESDQLNMALFAQIMDITCADLDLILQSAYTHGDDTCHQAQLMGAYCGCPTAPKPCHFCKDDQEITLPYHYHYHANKYFDISATCAQLQIGLLQYNDDSRECFLAQETNWECGCNNGFNGYLGTETSRQQRVLTWAGRASGLLGFLGAMFILLDNTILDKQGLRKKSIYRQLMCFVASLDALSALIWIVGPVRKFLSCHWRAWN